MINKANLLFYQFLFEFAWRFHENKGFITTCPFFFHIFFLKQALIKWKHNSMYSPTPFHWILNLNIRLLWKQSLLLHLSVLQHSWQVISRALISRPTSPAAPPKCALHCCKKIAENIIITIHLIYAEFPLTH
jgi:hypothetical protein